MNYTQSFTLKDIKYMLKYNKVDKFISLSKNNEEELFFEDRKDLFYFVNQLTDFAEEVKEIEESV